MAETRDCCNLCERKRKEGFLEGLVEGIIAKHLWNKETRNAKKDKPYMWGMIVATNVHPVALACFLYDLAKGNYRKKYSANKNV